MWVRHSNACEYADAIPDCWERWVVQPLPFIPICRAREFVKGSAHIVECATPIAAHASTKEVENMSKDDKDDKGNFGDDCKKGAVDFEVNIVGTSRPG